MKYFLISLIVIILSPNAHSNVVGVDAQNFNPTTSGLDFVTVHSSKTLAPGIFNFGLFFNYAANTLPYYENTATQQKFKPVDTLLSMDLNMGIGLMNNWDMGISIPQVLHQNIDDNSTAFRGFFEETGVNEIRLNTKYRFWDGVSQGMAVIASVNFFLIEDYPFITSPDQRPPARHDNTINKFKWGVNVGYRFQRGRSGAGHSRYTVLRSADRIRGDELLLRRL